MNNDTLCPICCTPLEDRTVTPCMDCGGEPNHHDNLSDKSCEFKEIEVISGIHLTLCPLCRINFNGYCPIYFGLPDYYPLDYRTMPIIQVISSRFMRDKYCPFCCRRLAFLQFLIKVRNLKQGEMRKVF